LGHSQSQFDLELTFGMNEVLGDAFEAAARAVRAGARTASLAPATLTLNP
jgi:hypothetical protein